MFGSSRQTIFKPSVYEPGRRTRRVPRWLVLLCAGIVAGAGGLLFVQHNYGPQQLTVDESRKLLDNVDTLTLERQNLRAQLAEAQGQRAQSQSALEKATGDLAQANERVATLTQTLQILQDAVPADPRGGNIGVRWGEFVSRGGEVAYRALVMREQAGKLPAFQGQFVVELAGTRNGHADTIVSAPVPFTLERFAPMQGAVALPDGFVPRQATLRVSDAQGRVQSMRIYFVRGAEGAGRSQAQLPHGARIQSQPDPQLPPPH
jgi:hypothetical protein